jgi:hypothetical protein
MRDVEILDHGRQREVADLCDGRKPPNWSSASDGYLKIPEQNVGAPIIEFQFHTYYIAFPEFGCTIDELGESLGVKIDLIEESYFQGIELRGVDEGDEVL